MKHTNPQELLKLFIENIAKLKPTKTYYVVEKDYASIFYSLLKFGFEKGLVSSKVKIGVSFYYADDSAVAFQIEDKGIMCENGFSFLNEHKEGLEKILKTIPILDIPERDRLTFLSAV